MPQLDTFRHHYTISHATTYRMYEKEASKHSESRWKLRRGKMTPQLQVTKKLCQKSLERYLGIPCFYQKIDSMIAREEININD